MATISFQPDRRSVRSERGETVLEASLRAGIPHTHACGGNARCSTCRVLILRGLEHCGERTAGESAIAERLEFRPEIRLACQLTISGDVTLRRLVLDPEDISLTDQRQGERMVGAVGDERNVTILFSDIRNFTSYAEGLLPYDVIHLLNRHFYEMRSVIERHGGRITSTSGDGLMALFGMERVGMGARAAVRAGWEMLAAAARLSPYLERLHGRAIEIGIGVDTGPCIVGALIGLDAPERTTAIGDTVNTASRIETANKRLGTHFLISQATYQRADSMVDIKVHEGVNLPGKQHPFTLYEVRGVRGEE